MNTYLIHYGVPRRSGRYKYGSGKNPRALRSIRRISKKIDRLETKKTNVLLPTRRIDRFNPSRRTRKIHRLEKKVDKFRSKAINEQDINKKLRLYNKHNKYVYKLTNARYKKRKSISKKQEKLEKKIYKMRYKDINQRDIDRGKRETNRILGR